MSYPTPPDLPVELAPLDALRPHPRNYREHPEEQVAHLIASVREHGVYRPILIARDGTVLAGHGVLRACGRIGMESVPVVRLDLGPDDPRALKILAADNTLSRLAEDAEADLAALLSDVAEAAGLLGTGYTEEELDALLGRTEETLAGVPVDDPEAEWDGMPEFRHEDKTAFQSIHVHFKSAEDAQAFARLIGQTITEKTRAVWYPKAEIERYADKAYSD